MTRRKRKAKQNDKNTKNSPLRTEGTVVIHKLPSLLPRSYFQDAKKLEIDLRTLLALVGYTAK